MIDLWITSNMRALPVQYEVRLNKTRRSAQRLVEVIQALLLFSQGQR